MTTRGRGTVRECPVPARAGSTCKAYVAAGRLMCVTHWRQVPPEVRTRVWRTWGRWNETHDPDDWAAYLLARQDALDLVGAPDGA